MTVNTLRPRHNGRHLADDIFKFNFLYENCCIFNQISFKIICKSQFDNIPSLVQIIPDSKFHGASMGPVWGRQDPGGPHVGPMNIAIWDGLTQIRRQAFIWTNNGLVYWRIYVLLGPNGLNTDTYENWELPWRRSWHMGHRMKTQMNRTYVYIYRLYIIYLF